MGEPLWMARMDLADFDQAILPMGWGLRAYHPGDEWQWLYILRQANPDKRYKNSAFQDAFSAHAGELPRRLFFLVNPQGKDIGAAAAWLDDTWQDPRSGYLCHIILLPEGKALRETLVRAALERMNRLGHMRAYAQCSPEEIGLYASLGFQPLIQGEADRKTWEKIRTALPWPEGEKYAPIEEKDWARKTMRKQMV